MVSNSVVRIVNEENERDFDYVTVRSKYFEVCSNAFKKPFSVTGPWTVEAREFIIRCIKKGNIELTENKYDLDADVLTKYQVVLENGEEKLVITGTAIEVLPYEECFDVFVDAHRATDHGNFLVMQMVLADKFVVYNLCLKFFLCNCNVCPNRALKKKPDVFNDRVLIEIQKLPIENESNSYMLFYVDKATTYKLFKPLNSSDESELCIEILKIFTDFGPPLVIETVHVDLLNKVLRKLNRAGLKYNIPIYKVDTKCSEITECFNLMSYILDTDAENWKIACRFVQYRNNKNDLPKTILRRKLRSVCPLVQLFCIKRDHQKNTKQTNPLMNDIENKNTSESIDSGTSSSNIVECLDSDKSEAMDTESVENNIIVKMDVDEESNIKTEPTNLENLENIIVKEEISIEDTKIAGGSNETNQNVHISIVQSTSKSNDQSSPAKEGSDKEKDNICCACKGKMLTDFFCYVCKKRCHIFCLTRIQKVNERETENISTFTYCPTCTPKK